MQGNSCSIVYPDRHAGIGPRVKARVSSSVILRRLHGRLRVPDDPLIDVGSGLADREENAGFIAKSLLKQAAENQRLILATTNPASTPGTCFSTERSASRESRSSRRSPLRAFAGAEPLGWSISDRQRWRRGAIHLHSVGLGSGEILASMRLPPVGEKPGRGASQRTLTEPASNSPIRSTCSQTCTRRRRLSRST